MCAAAPLLISAYSPIYVQAIRVDRCRNSPTGLGRAAGDLRTATSAGADERLGQGQQAAGRCRPAASGGTTYGPTNAVAVAALQQARFVESLFHTKDTETNFFLHARFEEIHTIVFSYGKNRLMWQ
jgi:hypothetical protein